MSSSSGQRGVGDTTGSGRAVAIVAAVGLLITTLVAVSFGTSPIVGAVPDGPYSDSDTLDSLPAAQQLELPQFDPALGALTSLTLTATLDGDVDASVYNLTDVPRSTTVVFDANADFEGAGVDLATALDQSTTEVLQPDVERVFVLSDSDSSAETFTTAAVLTAFTGTGIVTFDLTGQVEVNVFGPAAWRTKGNATAEATIEVVYEYTPGETTTTASSTTTTSTSTTSTTTTTPTTTSTSTTTTTTPTTTSTSTTTTTTPTTTSTTTTTTTPPTCSLWKLFKEPGFSLPVGPYSGGNGAPIGMPGTFTILTAVPADDPTTITWSSTNLVRKIWFDRFPDGPPDADYGSGVLSGTVNGGGDPNNDYLHVEICV